MSTIEATSAATTHAATHAHLPLKLEVVVIPVSDVDRAKGFYDRLGWRLDADFHINGTRIVQFTPPGSPCSIHFGANQTSAAPGSARGLFLCVHDLPAARDELVGHGANVSEIFHLTGFNRLDPSQRKPGLAPDRRSYGSFATFSDPDGNEWLLQEVTSRLPGRADPDVTSFGSAAELSGALRRAAAAHGEHEKRTGSDGSDWPDWYAEYIAAEQAGRTLPS